MNVVVDGLMTNYQRVGNGNVILCLPGWADTTKSFSKLAVDLQKEYQFLILDLPGFGGTQAPPSTWGLNDYSIFISDWLKKIGIGKVFAIVGHSYGGAIAVSGLSAGNLHSERLVLLAAAGIRDKKNVQKKLTKTATKVGKIPMYLLPKPKRQKIRAKFYQSIGSDMTLLPHMEETYKKIITEDTQMAAKTLNIPTLLIYGNQDAVTPVGDGKILNTAIAGSRLDVIDAGHFLHQEKPEEVAGLIKRFLSNE